MKRICLLLLLIPIALSAILLLYFKPTFTSYATYKISRLFEDLPVNKNVEVSGYVVKVLKNYISRKGYVYQRFYLKDETGKSIFVFCKVDKRELRIAPGDRLIVRGKFIKYKNKYEIICYTSNVQIV